MKRAVVLLSGGLDSAVTLAIAKRDGFEPHALSFDYGQRHRVELDAARRVAQAAGVRDHRVAQIDLRVFGGSALTDDIPVPLERSVAEIGHGHGIPVTYVPARNTIFLSYALAWSEVTGAAHIFLGVNSVDYSDYPDCRTEFLQAFEHLASVGTKSGVEGTRVRVHAPLLHLSKADIVLKGAELEVNFALTHSCYDPDVDGISCGKCDACQLRLKGFREAGLTDPIRYAA
ncbi:MAG: 7-cyano-7-deazaguanine synthase QueC [Chthoniobacterales bacterium]|nr:7-cyano-7-deazaguanine synthase QueC [Chthoniobacterales bacterium]